MNNLQKLIEICQRYIDNELDIAQFQSQLEMVFLPDDYKNTLEKKQYNAVNTLEEIRFCYLPENQYQQACQVAENLKLETEYFMDKR